MWSGWLNGNKIVENTYATGSPNTGYLYDGFTYNVSSDFGGYPHRNAAGLHGVNIGVFTLNFRAACTTAGTEATVRGYLTLNSPYLATINNLPTPVQKTADKTMKITYILREAVV